MAEVTQCRTWDFIRGYHDTLFSNLPMSKTLIVRRFKSYNHVPDPLLSNIVRHLFAVYICKIPG